MSCKQVWKVLNKQVWAKLAPPWRPPSLIPNGQPTGREGLHGVEGNVDTGAEQRAGSALQCPISVCTAAEPFQVMAPGG